MKLTKEEIAAREAIEIPLEPDEFTFDEAWRTEYVSKAYTDQLGVEHSATVVYERVILQVRALFEQYEYYGERFYRAGKIAYDEQGGKWIYRANLVDYTGGGSWRPAVPRLYEKGLWGKAGYSKKGEPVKGAMLLDGSPATRLLDEPFEWQGSLL